MENYPNRFDELINSAGFQEAKRSLVFAIQQASQEITKVKKPDEDFPAAQYERLVDQVGKARGRPLMYPLIYSGLGNGPLMELADGSVKYDMITGIGVNFFGHSHPALIEIMVDGLSKDVMQGNLAPGIQGTRLLDVLLDHVRKDTSLRHGWFTGSGTMANEMALKIIRQKKHPAYKVIAFKHCFTGRSSTMQEITDNPKYRQDQPTFNQVKHISFYDSELGLKKSLDQTLGDIDAILKEEPDQYAALMVELVQGEGGFNEAPTAFFEAIFERAKKDGLAIWVDEVQTFGRTGELFAFKKYSVGKYVDVVTVGKLLQACGLLFSEEYNPKPGLVAGTFSGSTVALATGQKIVDLLWKEGHLGSDGQIAKLSSRFGDKLKELAEGECKGMIGQRRIVGGMIAFEIFDGSMDKLKLFLKILFDEGVIGFSCGHGPYLVRFLPPLPAMQEHHVDEVCEIVKNALIKASTQ